MKRLIACIALAVAVAGLAWAQTSDNGAPPEGASSEVAAKQEFIKGQFDKLIKKLTDVAIALEKSKPEIAKTMLQAADEAR